MNAFCNIMSKIKIKTASNNMDMKGNQFQIKNEMQYYLETDKLIHQFIKDKNWNAHLIKSKTFSQ